MKKKGGSDATPFANLLRMLDPLVLGSARMAIRIPFRHEAAIHRTAVRVPSGDLLFRHSTSSMPGPKEVDAATQDAYELCRDHNANGSFGPGGFQNGPVEVCLSIGPICY